MVMAPKTGGSLSSVYMVKGAGPPPLPYEPPLPGFAPAPAPKTGTLTGVNRANMANLAADEQIPVGYAGASGIIGDTMADNQTLSQLRLGGGLNVGQFGQYLPLFIIAILVALIIFKK
ncbi:MAG: hypothetical protein KAV87_51630 [Desulfobacteraceae bacterium]|nr:hypothetical protein [Desulfobacteraceae bacterium]